MSLRRPIGTPYGSDDIIVVSDALKKIVDGMLPEARYVNAVYKLLSNISCERSEGREELYAILMERGIMLTAEYRTNFVKRLAVFKNNQLWDNYYIIPYCRVHPIPKPDEVFNGNCKDCYADYEVKFFTDSNYYKRLI